MLGLHKHAASTAKTGESNFSGLREACIPGRGIDVTGLTEKERQIGFQVKAINNLIRRKLDIRFAEAGLEELVGMQGPLLGYLDKNTCEGDVFQKDIEKEFHIRRSTATVMLQNLEQKGYLVREPVESDARLKRIVLTDKAKEMNRVIREQIDAFNEELEKDITEEEKAFFLHITDKIMLNLK